MDIKEFRQKYPQYNDLSDEQLAKGLHKKYYSDMPFDKFAGKFGYSVKSEQPQKQNRGSIIEFISEAGKGARDALTMVERAASGFTLGGTDWLGDKLGLGTTERKKRIEDEYGSLGKLANIGAETTGNLVGAGGALLKAGSKSGLKGLGLASGTGAVEGAAYGATGSDSLKELPANMLIGSTIGAVTPYAINTAVKPFSVVGKKGIETLKHTGNILKDKKQLFNLTIDQNSAIIPQVIKRAIGKGDSLDDVLNKENQRLLRQEEQATRIINARKIGNEAKIRGYDVTTPASKGNDGTRISRVARSDVVGRWTPNEPIKSAITSPLSFNEYVPNMKNAKRFSSIMSDFKKNGGATSEQVYQYPVNEYSKMRMFLTDDEKTGFAIKPDGDIVSVFNGNRSAKRGADAILEAAVSAGGKKLDAYDTYLPEIYSRHGFKEVSRDAWSEEYKPKNWNKLKQQKFNLGEPDVVYMKYDPKYYGQYKAPNSLENVVNRLQNNISNEKQAIKNIWLPNKSNANDTAPYLRRSFIEALADKNDRRTMRNAVMSGAGDLSENANILGDMLSRRKDGMFDKELEDAIITPQLKLARESYQQFMSLNGSKKIPQKQISKFYNENPVAQDMIEGMRTVDPQSFKGVKPGSFAEFDVLKRALREQSSNMTAEVNRKSGAKNAEKSLKDLMEKNFKGFKDVNKQYAEAQTAQDLFESKLKKGITSVGGATNSPFWSGISTPLATVGGVGGFYNPVGWALTGAGLTGKALMRTSRRNAGRNIANGISPYVADTRLLNSGTVPAIRSVLDYFDYEPKRKQNENPRIQYYIDALQTK